MVGDLPYKLLQFHFHTPSEHVVDGERYAMKVHLVHRSADGNLAVVGVFPERSESNAVVQMSLDNASKTIGEITVPKGISISAVELLPGDHSFHHHAGSLTTPPCSENVNWFVMETPIGASDQQVNRIEQVAGYESAYPVWFLVISIPRYD
ncbi:MAG: carbonic anhydrase family protein [Gammaproteobacteria bacterium]|nr:carbonic anhydrase family protein [Gammaproteobacteria bacterium]